MSKVNWVRVFLGGLIATVICFMTDGFLHEVLVKGDWQAVFDALHAPAPMHEGSAYCYFGIFELGRGFLALFVYVMMRARSGAGPKTAVWAGVVSWFAFSLTGPAQFIPLGFFSTELWVKASVFQLITSVVATLGGAVLYKES